MNKNFETIKKHISNIRKELKTYIEKNKLESLVIGVSGGIDSALCCALAKPVCDELKIPLIGRSLPILSNKRDELERAKEIGEQFCNDFLEIDLADVYESFYMDMEPMTTPANGNENKIRLGNVKARLRMIYLYDLAQKNRGMVLSTDNYTELLLGFWTLHGDVGDYGMVQSLWKTEVYEMSRYITIHEGNQKQKDALISCIGATPTDGLGITNSDLDQLGVESYDVVDSILKSYLEGDDTLEDNVIIQRYKRTQFKRENPYNIPRKDILNESE